MKVFDIDFRKLVILLLPSILRGGTIMSMLRVLIEPLHSLSYRHKQAREKTLFELQHNGQVCYMRAALNHQFARTRVNGFEIIDVCAEGDYLIAYDEAEHLADRHLIINDAPYCTVAYNESTIWATKNFIVLCPSDIFDNEEQMPIVRKIVEQYRLVSRLPEYQRKNA